MAATSSEEWYLIGASIFDLDAICQRQDVVKSFKRTIFRTSVSKAG